MIRGRLTALGEPIVPVTLRGSRDRLIEAVLDTGFTGHICLAKRNRRGAALTRIGNIETELADGSRIKQVAYLGTVVFDGASRRVLVTLSEADDSLIGTALLLDKRVSIDFPRGRVTVSG